MQFKSSSRWLKFSKELREDVCACFNVLNKGKCWVTSRCVLRAGGMTPWRDSLPTNEKYFKLAKSRGKPCPNKVLIAEQNHKLFRLANHRLFNMSKLSMVRHLTQMPCDFVDKLKAKGRKLLFGKIQNSNID